MCECHCEMYQHCTCWLLHGLPVPSTIRSIHNVPQACCAISCSRNLHPALSYSTDINQSVLADCQPDQNGQSPHPKLLVLILQVCRQCDGVTCLQPCTESAADFTSQHALTNGLPILTMLLNTLSAVTNSYYTPCYLSSYLAHAQ